MLIVTSVLLVVLTSMATFFNVIQRTSMRQDKRNEVTDNMRLAMERITKEIRQATAIRDGSGGSLLDFDTYVDGTATHLTYTAAGTTLSRTVSGHAQTLLTGLTTVTGVFTYSPGITNATDVTIDLHARPTRFSTDPTAVELTSQVRLRNRRAS